jgi:hypothetical protein
MNTVKGGSYKACAFVTGDDALQDELQSIRLATHKAMLIIRDPPGGMSFASYQNIQATVVLEAHKRSHFVGVDAGVSLKVGFAEEGLVCLHIGAAQCIKNVEMDVGDIGASDGASFKSDTGNFNDEYSGYSTATWSYATSGMSLQWRETQIRSWFPI